jgi:hypothetical protein
MVTRIEIRQVHPDSVDKKGWKDGTGISVQKSTITNTRVDLPDQSGVYDTGLLDGEIVLDLSGIGKQRSDKHTLRIESALVGGEHVLDVSNGSARKQLGEQLWLDVNTDALPKVYTSYPRFVPTGFGNLYGEDYYSYREPAQRREPKKTTSNLPESSVREAKTVEKTTELVLMDETDETRKASIQVKKLLDPDKKYEELRMTVDPSQNDWQKTVLGEIKVDPIVIDETGLHSSIRIHYKAEVLGERGSGNRVRVIQLNREGIGQQILRSTGRERILTIDTGLKIQKPEYTPKALGLRPEYV